MPHSLSASPDQLLTPKRHPRHLHVRSGQTPSQYGILGLKYALYHSTKPSQLALALVWVHRISCHDFELTSAWPHATAARTLPPGVAAHRGQNQSAAGTVVRAGVRHFRW